MVLLLTAAVGLNQLAFVLTGTCPAGLTLARLGFRLGAEWRCSPGAHPAHTGTSTTL